MKRFLGHISLFLSLLFLGSCTIENLDETHNVPKQDFSTHNYVLATEDASDVDITTFFSFNWKDIAPGSPYDLIAADNIFTNSNPSTSSGHLSLGPYIYAMAKDKKGYSSTPGLYRLTLNDQNLMYIDTELNISRDNLFPARQITFASRHVGYFYDEGKEPYRIQIFDPLEMKLLGSIDLKPAIEHFRPNVKWTDSSGNNLVRTGSLVLQAHQGKLYVSIVFLETASFNLIANDENHFYLAVVDLASNQVEKIISYEGVKTVGFFVSENKATVADEAGNLYFLSWGWNQFNEPSPSQVFRIKSGETDFDPNWNIDIEGLFGKGRVAQSISTYNGKIYLHVSDGPYLFDDNALEDVLKGIKMSYYEFDPAHPDEPHKMDLPTSDASSRMSVFSIVDDKLYISVPNHEKGKFNGIYSLDRQGKLTKEMTIDNKYRPTRLYKLGE